MCGKRLRSLLGLLALVLLLCSPVYLAADGFGNLSKSELIDLVEQLEAELVPAGNKTIELENNLQKVQNELVQAKSTIEKAENSQKELAITFQTLVTSYEKLSKNLNPGISLGISVGVLAIPVPGKSLQLGAYGGVILQF